MVFRMPGRLASVLIGVGLFTASLAAAATLGASTRSLGAGNTTVSSCTAALRATYAVAWDATTKAYKISTVTLKGDTTTCPTGGLLTVDLGDSGNSSLYEFRHSIVAGDIAASAAIVLTPASTVAAASVKGVFAGLTG